MKTRVVVAVIAMACLAVGYACYRLGQTSGFSMGFTQGLYAFAKTADEQRKRPNGDVVFTSREWPDTLRGLTDLRKNSGASAFVPWEHNPDRVEAMKASTAAATTAK